MFQSVFVCLIIHIHHVVQCIFRQAFTHLFKLTRGIGIATKNPICELQAIIAVSNTQSGRQRNLHHDGIADNGILWYWYGNGTEELRYLAFIIVFYKVE